VMLPFCKKNRALLSFLLEYQEKTISEDNT